MLDTNFQKMPFPSGPQLAAARMLESMTIPSTLPNQPSQPPKLRVVDRIVLRNREILARECINQERDEFLNLKETEREECVLQMAKALKNGSENPSFLPTEVDMVCEDVEDPHCEDEPAITCQSIG